MTAEQLTAIVGYIIAAAAGGIIRHFWPKGVPSPASPAPILPGTSPASHDRPLANLLMQLLAAIAGGQLAIPTPAMPTSPTPLAAGGPGFPQAGVNGSPASLVMSVNGRSFVLPIDLSVLGLQPGAATNPAPSTG